MVTNLNVQKCANAKTTYLACVNYALTNLAKVGVYMYMDAGHAGWLGWPANLSPAAQLFAKVYTTAGKSSFIKGLATSKSRAWSSLPKSLLTDNRRRRCELQRLERRFA